MRAISRLRHGATVTVTHELDCDYYTARLECECRVSSELSRSWHEPGWGPEVEIVSVLCVSVESRGRRRDLGCAAAARVGRRMLAGLSNVSREAIEEAAADAAAEAAYESAF